MPLPYHTHIFKLEPATKEEVKEGVLDSKALAPVSVGSAAAYEVEYFATAAQGKKADDAIAKRDIGALAYKNKVTIHDIEASGEAHENAILSGAGWVKISPLGIGDMKAATYDPDNVGTNAFSMENMNEGPTKKILTTEERSKLRWLSSTQPTMEKWRRGDEGVYYPISPVDLKNTIRYFVGSKSVGMSKSVYDPDKIEKDAFDMENMKEGNTHLILTPQERAQVAKIDKVEDVAQQGIHVASEAKNVADSALRTANDAKAYAVDAKKTAETAQKTGDSAKAEANIAQTAADKAQDTAHSVQKKVDLIQPLAKQDWIDGTKTVDALISPAKLMASIKANSSNSSGGSSGNNDGGVRKPVEILMTESGDIPLPDGITADTDIEVWAWGGGGGGVKDGGGGGGQCVHVKMKGSDLDKLKTAYIGRGGKGNDSNILCNGGRTMIKGLVTAEGGYSVSMTLVNFGGKGGDGGGNREGSSGESFIFSGGNGGGSGIDGKRAGTGGSSFLGGGGGGGGKCKGSIMGQGGESYKGGNGGRGGKECGGGGGGYFDGKHGSDKIGGDGGDGAVLIKVYL
ncbi:MULTISPECIES: alanine-zipper protein [unclassified Bartonella]|uniref:glycine-rich domain-containing protein n=1 Tax=unclassified Bartonella TaxID=2645622 RepID=UPI0035CF0442